MAPPRDPENRFCAFTEFKLCKRLYDWDIQFSVVSQADRMPRSSTLALRNGMRLQHPPKSSEGTHDIFQVHSIHESKCTRAAVTCLTLCTADARNIQGIQRCQ